MDRSHLEREGCDVEVAVLIARAEALRLAHVALLEERRMLVGERAAILRERHRSALQGDDQRLQALGLLVRGESPRLGPVGDERDALADAAGETIAGAQQKA